ncbi:MAG: DNA-3-methyladenine glycosylase [Thermoproteota archaeon]|nr:DNA-3-methyladenine glycosylase [Thermoproteota archaeon]
MTVLRRSFYARNTVAVAKELLSKRLVRQTEEGVMVGKVVEVEAYGGNDDPASHAYEGKTSRNQVMFGKAGCAYVYFIYGKHHCFNVTTEKEGVPGAVLIRAVEPIEGINMMQRNRGAKNLVNLTNGPGKLTEAMHITKAQNGLDLTLGEEIFIREPETIKTFETVSTRRMGVKANDRKCWRFYIKSNRFVSHFYLSKVEMSIAVLVIIAIIVNAGTLWYGMSVLNETSKLTDEVAKLTGTMTDLTEEVKGLATTVGGSLEALENITDRLTAIEERLAPKPIITVIGPWSGEEREAFMPVLHAFELRTGIPVRYRIYRAEDLATLLPAQFDAGATPGDLIFMWAWFIKDIGPDGDALNVTDLVDEADLSPGALDPVKVGDTLYGGAYTGKVKPGFWYRKSFFEANNLTEPESWDEFVALLDDIAAIAGIQNPIVTGDGKGWPISDVVDHFLITYGGPDLQRSLITGDVDWTSTEVKTIFEDKLVPLLEAGYFSEPTEWTTAVDLWWGGDYGLYFMGSWITGMVEDPADLGVFSLPGTEGLVFAADYFFIPTYTEHSDEAKELFKFLISEEAQEIQVGEGGHIATNIHVALEAYPPVDREVAELMEGMEAMLDLDDTIGGEFQTTFWDQLKLLWVDPTKLDDVLAAIQEKAP